MGGAFRALRNRNFRLFWVGQLISLIGTWAQNLAQGWLIVLLVIVQYSTSGAIVRTHQMRMIGQKQSPTDLLLHVLHNRLGLLLTALMVWRLLYRLWAGAPSPQAPLPGRAWSARASVLTHAGFYAVLIAEGATGAIASSIWWPISAAHVVLFKLLLGLTALHVAAVLWHQLILRDAILRRMGPRRRSLPAVAREQRP